jgi:hypothetical protein
VAHGTGGPERPDNVHRMIAVPLVAMARVGPSDMSAEPGSSGNRWEFV